ncbi:MULTISPECIES: dynamin family protein [Bacillus]|uniref:dynamin family protein n=1 Tax=Bacillus TaxID=1386 RepID=UPI0002F91E26|nr:MULTISPECIES: dynamin family protein [Bacillus]
MTLENHLSKKTYFKTLCNEENTATSMEKLGQMFLEENKKEFADLSYIRFAQGEVYYQYRDYEAAIFKWENISNELESWAKKNVGDAYFELNLLPTAIETLKTIQTDNITLQTEIDLKLFQIYIEQSNHELAVKHIKAAVSLNPEYQHITEIARAYFEQNKDWENAVELAVSEANRTDDVYWIDILIDYAQNGNTQKISPSYFTSVLENVHRIDDTRFEKLTCSLWKSYQFDDQYVQWIITINELLASISNNESSIWKELSKVFEETFIDLISGGRYELKELTSFLPMALENWVDIVKPSQGLMAYSALLAWNEFFPDTISQRAVQFSENNIWESANNPHVLEDSLELFYELTEWASEQNVEITTRLRWLIQEILDLTKQNVLVIGVNRTGKSTFINSVLKEQLFLTETKNTVRVKHGEHIEMNLVSDQEVYTDSDLNHVQEMINQDEKLHSTFITDVAIPSDLLEKYSVTLIDTPGFRGKKDEEEVTDFLPLADSLLFVLDAEDPFTEQERDILLNIKQQAPHLPVSFVVTKLDTIYNKQEAKRMVEETKERIAQYEPNAKVISFSSKYEIAGQENEMTNLFASLVVPSNQKEKRAIKLLQVIRRTIFYLLQKRQDKEIGLEQAILWNEDMLKKLNGAINQLQDYEKESADVVTSKYRLLKSDMKTEMEEYIPKMLKDCGELLKEDSDFRKVHLQLNEEMNSKIQLYMEERLAPRFYQSLQEWILDATSELERCKLFFEEMSESFNGLYNEEKVNLQGDFRVLDDWNRDIRRMTSGVRIERENILLRHTPSQFLLKSAGKLFGALPQNKTMLYNQYKKFIENENYAETTNSVISKFMLSFEMFEKAIERDIHLFFSTAIKEMEDRVKEAHVEINTNEELLNEMRETPEIYKNALTLFEIRLRQYEWMIGD